MSQPVMRLAGTTEKPLRRKPIPFTITSIANLKLRAGRNEEWVYDSKTPHLAYRMRASGAAAFYWYGKHKGEPRKDRLGAAGEITIEQARAMAAKRNADNANDIDWREEQKQKRVAAEKANLKLREIWDQFIADKTITQRPATIRNYKSYMEGDALGDWLDKPVVEITNDVVFSRHRELGKKSGQAFANGSMRVLRAVFNFGVALGKVKSNPTVVLKNRWYEIPRRRTKIDDDQLPEWFKATAKMRVATIKSDDGTEIPDETARLGADYLEFVLFTGMRRNEACRLEWDRVDFEKRRLTVLDTKNGHPLILPLSEYLLAMLKRRSAESGNSKWVFPSPGRKGKECLAEPRCVIERVTALSGITHTTHDLRRTFVTVATRLVPHAVAKVLVNHTEKSDDITQDYVTMTVEELRPHVETIAKFFQAAAHNGPQAAQDEAGATKQ